MAPPTKERLQAALKECYDPEIPVNIIDLGLIRRLEIDPEGRVFLDMTLTAVGCPVTEWMRSNVREKLMSVEGVTDATVEIEFEPPWTPAELTGDGRDMLQAMGFPV